MKTILDVTYNAKTQKQLDIYLPESPEFPVMVYFHGGGLTAGARSQPKIFFEYLASHGIAVVSASYRLYPNAKYPDFLEDAADVVAWVFHNMGSYGKLNGVYVCGTSAGGYMSQMLCFDKTWLSARNIKPTDIAGYIHDAGQPTCHFNVLKERGIDSRRVIIDDTAPLYHVGEDEQYPPMLIIVSDNDMENRYEQTMLLISTLKHFGHTENIQLKIMNGKHCAYIGAADENGESIFGKLVEAFICGQ